jgi:membrane-bound metal-dependent hydrolase YbcI (DUF457 family)
MVSHQLLDAMTDGGRGVMLLLPFTRTRLFFPWRPIHTPPGGLGVLTRALSIRHSELVFCLGAIMAGVSGLIVQKRSMRIQECDVRRPASPP